MLSPTLDISLQPLRQVANLAGRWQTLEEQADSGFFLGWTWIGSWLAATAAQPDLLSVRLDGKDVALALIGRTMRQRPLGRIATRWLNQCGDPAGDRCFIEYNGLLMAPDAPRDTAGQALSFLASLNDWRVLRLGGIPASSALANASHFHRHTLVQETPAWFIDLSAVRAAGGDYLSLLSANARAQIRRSAKDYGEAEVLIARAANEAETGAWLSEMAALNAGRHGDNAWEEPVFLNFVRLLVMNGMTRGDVELLRFSKGGHLLGFLLNFLGRGQAMNYQSAFPPGISPKAKPGLMTHAAAVAHYAQADLDRYSLLAGNDRYKQSLATGHELLQWWDLERFSPRLEAEHALRRLLRRPVSA